jgi:hypothetical protein
MKKIGILFGQERSFPHALIDRINSKKVKGIQAEPVSIDKVVQAAHSGCTLLPGFPEKYSGQWHRRDQQPLLVECGRKVLQQHPV